MLRRTLILAVLSFAIAGLAEARQETLRWTHPLGAPEVASFHIYVGSSPGATDLVSQNVGLPTPDGSGVYTFTVDLGDNEETVFVHMTAVDASAVPSAASNTVTRSVPLGMPGTPVVAVP